MISLTHNEKKLFGTVPLPSSKSISNRLLILQFLAGQSLQLRNLSHSDDTVLLSSLLQVIRQYRLIGEKGLLRIDVRNAGTVMRFLTALLAMTRGHYLLTGADRMQYRPVGILVNALREIGADIEYLENPGFLPLYIKGRTLSGRRITMSPACSSQFITALLLIAPFLEEGLSLDLTERPASWPYVKMTLDILSSLDIQVIEQENTLRVFPKTDISAEINVAPDWSAASFWYCMLSLAENGELFFPYLNMSGLQGDQQAASLFSLLGVETKVEDVGTRIIKKGKGTDEFSADFRGYPDLAMPVIMACAGNGVKGWFKGLENLRYKESDRLHVLSRELGKAGVIFLEAKPGVWELSGKVNVTGAFNLDHEDDHRVAMTFAALAIQGITVVIKNEEVVNKSYPGFWNTCESLRFNCIPHVDKI